MAWGSQGMVFLGEDLLHSRDYSEDTARVVDAEIARILRQQEERAIELLSRHRGGLDAVAQGPARARDARRRARSSKLVDTAYGRPVHEAACHGFALHRAPTGPAPKAETAPRATAPSPSIPAVRARAVGLDQPSRTERSPPAPPAPTRTPRPDRRRPCVRGARQPARTLRPARTPAPPRPRARPPAARRARPPPAGRRRTAKGAVPNGRPRVGPDHERRRPGSTCRAGCPATGRPLGVVMRDGGRPGARGRRRPAPTPRCPAPPRRAGASAWRRPARPTRPRSRGRGRASPTGPSPARLTTIPVPVLVKVSEYGTPVGIRVWLSAVSVTRRLRRNVHRQRLGPRAL